MFLMIAFACFFVMFAAWLIVPSIDSRAAATPAPESATAPAPTLQTQA